MGNIVKFAKPYSFEGTEYTEVDLSGMDKLTIQDMIDIQKSLANELASLAALEATTSFAQEMATKASGKPVEFFKLMPRAKIKQVQTAILLSLNAKTKSDPAKHKVINGKAKPEYVGPKLKEYTCDILLDAAHGVNPRKMLKRLTQMAEDGEVHYFIIGFAPLSENRFRITDVSESWDAVIKHGLLVQCKVSLTIKEYV